MRKSSNERPARKKTNIILRTPRKLPRSGEDYGKQKQKVIWTRRGSRKLRKVWERKWARKKIIKRVGVSVEEVKQPIGKKRNWSGAGREKIHNYWWKKLTLVHEQIAEAYENIINDAREIDIEWLVMGETELIPKEGD